MTKCKFCNEDCKVSPCKECQIANDIYSANLEYKYKDSRISKKDKKDQKKNK